MVNVKWCFIVLGALGFVLLDVSPMALLVMLVVGEIGVAIYARERWASG